MPDALDLPLTISAELGSAAAVVAELRDRLPAIFAPGTYWLHRFASVPAFET